jgi:hypothetical protein
MSSFKKVSNYIYRLEVPFFTVYTSVFLIDTPEGYILVDCATTDEDVDGYIIPALQKQGVELANVKKVGKDAFKGCESLTPVDTNGIDVAVGNGKLKK